jgi:hypothetical protein
MKPINFLDTVQAVATKLVISELYEINIKGEC